MMQQEQVAMAVTNGNHGGLRPRRWPTHTYVMPAGRLAVLPEPGTIVDTRPGAYWHVLASRLEDASMILTLEPVKPHSREAHGDVRPCRGGRLL